jgi:glycosyltransferase involved in cell wall biosynthesis
MSDSHEGEQMKIAFVVQRYGLEVNGGSELECRQYAEHLALRHDVEIITTKAMDYMTWEDTYTNDVDIINGILVHRFSVDYPRNVMEFNQFTKTIYQYQSSRADELIWMKKQGPYSTKLFQYIQDQRNHYDVFFFCTYVYCTTFFGLPFVKEKAILIPTAHDEPPIYLRIFKDFFSLPKGIFYNTVVEKKFIENRFHNENICNNQGLGGVGVEIPENVDGAKFSQKYGDYIIYIGRVEESKGCRELFNSFMAYKDRNRSDLKLLVIGKEVMEIPKHKDIIKLGFVSDEDKFNALVACKFLVIPSKYESLSMVLLEAMAMSKPVLVNGQCEVLKDHCTRSNAGLYYTNYYEFEETIEYLLNHGEVCEIMGYNGMKYVQENYQWDVITKRLETLISG